MSTRKKYSKEFKLDAISLVLEQCYSRAEAARSLGINATYCRGGSSSMRPTTGPRSAAMAS